LVGLSFGLLDGRLPGTALPGGCAWGAAPPARDERVVYLAGRLADEDLLALTSAVAARGPHGVVLLDTPRTSGHLHSFLTGYRPDRVVPVGSFPDGITDLEHRLGLQVAPAVPWDVGPPVELWQALFRQAETVVISPAEPRGLLLQAACLAGVLKAPLYVIRSLPDESGKLQDLLRHWETKTVIAAGGADRLCCKLRDVDVVRLPGEKTVGAAYLRHQLERGPIQTLVVANPADVEQDQGRLSSLAPWVALQHRAALLLTNAKGDNVAAVVDAALRHRELRRADALILVADLQAIPMEQRPNPVADGKDPAIEMEPLTPSGVEPFSFATGRLFHEDPGVVALLLARQRLLAEARSPRKALIVSNPAGGLPLLEAFSRNTAQELRNGGYQTTAVFGKEVNKDDLRRLLPEQDIFLWEGHYNTLVKEYGLPDWTEPLRPSLIFLQSCLTLKDAKAQPLLERGGVGLIGSSTRTFSGTGGACALAFFNALLYEDQSVGGSLRQAKNFLLAYSLLKEKRLGKDARLGGANLRSAWAFSLWGDPTLKLVPPTKPEDSLAPVRHEVRGNTIVITLPDMSHEKTTTSKYQAQILPNARLAGLLSKEADDDGQRLVPFIFAEVHLPKAPAGKVPGLHSRVPSRRWVFCWDPRRRCGYLLVTPRAKDREELRFQVEWQPPGAAPPSRVAAAGAKPR
jgi:hypothetical protein